MSHHWSNSSNSINADSGPETCNPKLSITRKLPTPNVSHSLTTEELARRELGWHQQTSGAMLNSQCKQELFSIKGHLLATSGKLTGLSRCSQVSHRHSTVISGCTLYRLSKSWYCYQSLSCLKIAQATDA